MVGVAEFSLRRGIKVCEIKRGRRATVPKHCLGHSINVSERNGSATALGKLDPSPGTPSL